MHNINITGVGEEKNGDKFVWAKSSSDLKLSVAGYTKVSIEMMMMCLTTRRYGDFIDNLFRLLSEFVYPTLLSKEKEEECKRVETSTCSY